MKKTLFILIALMGVLSAKAQKANETKDLKSDTRIYTAVEHEPEPPGGMAKFFENFGKKIHPTQKPGQQIRTKLLIGMVVEKDGRISHIKILKSISKETDKQAIRILKESPKWIPGMMGNKPVRVRYTIPMIIDFQGDE